MKTIDAKNLPAISDVSDDILDTAIICERSGRPFRVIPQELKFLQTHKLPLPRIHHELRIDDLLAQRPI